MRDAARAVLLHFVRVLAFYNSIDRFQVESPPLPRRLNARRLLVLVALQVLD